MNDSQPQEQSPEEEPRSRTKRTIAIALLIVFLAALGYAAVLFVAGSALQDAPFAGQIGAIRERLRSLTSVEPPETFPPVLEGEEGVELSPSPVVASPLPVPARSPRFIPPSPGTPTEFTFAVEFQNTTGVRLTGVQLTSTIPAGTRLAAGSPAPPAALEDGRLRWDIGTVDPNAGGRVEFKVLTNRRGAVTSEWTMTSNEAPPSQTTTTGRES
jgi:uncharacterized repeat protein (TIGR01451 family)